MRWVMEGQRGLDDALGCGTVVAVFVELVCGERILDGKGSEDGGQQHGSWWRGGGADPRCDVVVVI